MENIIDYWFAIEPYVFVKLTNDGVLLYNTLDGVTIESKSDSVIELLKGIIEEKNCGVILLKNDQFKESDIFNFIQEIREKFMGDIIDIALSKGKPVQLLPYFNFLNKFEVYKKHNFSSHNNSLKNLFEITIHVNSTIDVERLIPVLQSIPGAPTFNIVGNILDVINHNRLLDYFNQRTSPKNILCSYKNVIVFPSNFNNNFSYRILINLPIDMQQWEKSRHTILNCVFPVEYTFDISSEEDIQLVKHITEQYQIEKYNLNPVYTETNIRFFEENVFLTREDILSTPMTMKDFFSRQTMNIYDFGKINILPNGDAYANINHPVLGNIYTHSIYEILQKEIDEGQSWFRIRNQAPCTDCVYQWLCPPPSNYEIAIGIPNLCHVNK